MITTAKLDLISTLCFMHQVFPNVKSLKLLVANNRKKSLNDTLNLIQYWYNKHISFFLSPVFAVLKYVLVNNSNKNVLVIPTFSSCTCLYKYVNMQTYLSCGQQFLSKRLFMYVKLIEKKLTYIIASNK